MNAVEGQAKARQSGDVGFIRFLGQGVALEHFAGRIENAEEFLAQGVQLFLAERALKANDQIGADEAI